MFCCRANVVLFLLRNIPKTCTIANEMIFMKYLKKSTTYPTGVIRLLLPIEIAQIVKLLRYDSGFKQITLARKANVTERTIQRLEAGEKVDSSTLERVANAFKLIKNEFTKPHYIPTSDEAAPKFKKMFKEFEVINLLLLDKEIVFDEILNCSSYWIEKRNFLTKNQKEKFGILGNLLKEYGEIYIAEKKIAKKLKIRKELYKNVKELQRLGCLLKYQIYQRNFATHSLDKTAVKMAVVILDKLDGKCTQIFLPKKALKLAALLNRHLQATH
jgi:transcriptional regulator with XRE-family HTH domain